MHSETGSVLGRKIVGSEFIKPETTNRTKPAEGIVEDVGPDVTIMVRENGASRRIRAGDRVLFRVWTGIECIITKQMADGPERFEVVITEQKHVLATPEYGERITVK